MGNKQSRRSNSNQGFTSACSFEEQQQSQSCMPISTLSVPSSLSQQSQLSQTVLVTPQQSSTQAQSSRVVVDIRGANLDTSKYAVWVERQPCRQRAQQAAEALEGGVIVCSTALQAIGGLLVTVLTTHKLIEEIKLVRSLRRSSSKSAGTARSSGKTSKPASTSLEDTFTLPRHLAEQLKHSSLNKAGKQRNDSSVGTGLSSSCSKQQSAWSAVAGLQHVKMLLQEVTVLPLVRPDLFSGVRSPPSAVLLYGPPGTGKTLLAKAVAAASGASFFPVTGSSVLSKWYGESEQNVRRLFEEAAAAAPAVIFIDEVDSLLAKRGAAGSDGPGGAGEASRRVTNEFLAFIDGIAANTAGNGISSSSSSMSGQASCTAGRVVVIAATNAPWDLDEAALSRFTARMLVPLPDAAARQVILQQAMLGVRHSLDEDCFKRVAEQADGLSGRDLIGVCREASMRPMRELWGSRIMEGEAPRHCQQQQQLVAAVKAAMQQGSSHRKLRRSLERWKRQSGALWCNVDEVMRAGQQPTQGQQQQQQQQPQQQGLLEFSQQQLPDAQQPQQGRQQPEAQEGDTAECRQGKSTRQFQHNATATCTVHQTREEDVAGIHSTGDDPERIQPSRLLNTGPHLVNNTRASEPTSAAGLHSHPVTVENTSSLGNRVPLTDTSSLCEGAASVDNSSSDLSGRPTTWTLEDLMALPADAVRPVTVDDLQWALSQAGRVDALTDKYDEWTSRFGSGDGVNRAGRSSWRFLPMYA